MVVGFRPYTDRAGDGADRPSIDANAGEEIMHIQGDVTLVLGNRRPEHSGTLFITSQKVIWLSNEDRSKGYEVDFLSISLHAVSRDPEAYPSPCIYAQLQINDQCFEDAKEMDHDHHPNAGPPLSEEHEEPQHEWIFSADQLPAEGVDVGSGWTFSENITVIGYANDDHDLSRDVLQLQINDRCFEDAKEMDRDHHPNAGVRQ